MQFAAIARRGIETLLVVSAAIFLVNATVRSAAEAACDSSPNVEGYCKDLFIDAGTALTNQTSLPAAQLLNLSSDAYGGKNESVAEQLSVMVTSSSDLNGCLLYPDGAPRYRVVYVNGGRSYVHGPDLRTDGQQRFRDFYAHGGSYAGSCAGAFLASLTRLESKYSQTPPVPYAGYFHIWPGLAKAMGIANTYHGVQIIAPSSHKFLQKFRALENNPNGSSVSNMYHNGGPKFPRSPSGRPQPSGTENLAEFDWPIADSHFGSMNGEPGIVAYKNMSPETGRIVITASHPEFATRGSKRSLMAAMLWYAMDGAVPPTKVKQPLSNGQTVAMTGTAQKAGDHQYHYYTVATPQGATDLTISLTNASGTALFLRKDAFPTKRSGESDYSQATASDISSSSKSIVVASPAAATWYIGVYGAHETLNGVPYTLNVHWTSGGGTTPPSAPTALTATAGNGAVSLSWTAASGATSYTLKRGMANGGPYTAIASSLTATTYTNSGLVNGTPYYYVVVAVNAGGTSPASNEASATPQASAAPTLTLTASPTTITSGASSTLSWTSTNAASCTASGGWSGTQATSGSQSVSPAATASYALSCSGSGGSVTRSVTVTVESGSATCNHRIDAGVGTADAQSNYSGVKPGDTVCVTAGARDRLTFLNFKGTANAPVTIINAGGKVRINANSREGGIRLFGCRYVRVTGTGVASLEYGFELFNATNGGILTNQAGSGGSQDGTEHIELDHIEIHDVTTGIRSGQNKDAASGAWEGHGYHIHHNYIHDMTVGEGMYIGASTSSVISPIHDVHIHHNKIVHAGYDGIQVRQGHTSVRVYNNYIDGTGSDPRKNGTIDNTAGLNIAKGCDTGDWYNNIIINARKGAHIKEVSNIRVFNNLFIDAGHDTPWTPVEGAVELIDVKNVQVFNNTIVNTQVASAYGIQVLLGTTASAVFDNILAGSLGRPLVNEVGGDVSITNNLAAASVNSVEFVDPAYGNYHLTASSAAVNAASNSSFPSFDLDGVTRPQGARSDLGAYERQ